jgi:hypothetical protein
MFSSTFFNNNDNQILHKLANYVTHNTNPNRKILWYCDGSDGEITMKLWEYIYCILDDSLYEDDDISYLLDEEQSNKTEIELENIVNNIICDDMFSFDLNKLNQDLNLTKLNNATIDENFYCIENNIVDDFEIIECEKIAFVT